MVDGMKTVFGAAVLVLAVFVCLYYFRILKNLYHHEDVSLTLFFLDNDAPRAFQLLIGVGVIYGLAGVLVVIGTLYNLSPGTVFRWVEGVEANVFWLIPKAATVVALLGVIRFQQYVYRVTVPPSEREE